MMGDWLLTNTPLLTYLAHAHNITNTYAREIWKRHSHFCSKIDSIHLQAVEHIFILVFILFLHRNDMETLLLAGHPFFFTTVK